MAQRHDTDRDDNDVASLATNNAKQTMTTAPRPPRTSASTSGVSFPDWHMSNVRPGTTR
jgi:hypothetical protein